MQRIKKVITCFLTVIVLLSVAGSANAMKSSDYSVEIHVMTAEERNAFESQTEATPIVGTAFLSPNNEDGTNGSICAPFTAETANMAFVVKSAPGALNYNVQLYAGVPGAGERASNYATIEVNNGVYFSGLTVGQSYYMKISSNTLPTAGCTAIYAMLIIKSHDFCRFVDVSCARWISAR